MVRVDVQGPQVEEFVRVCPVLVASWLRDDLVEVFLGMELLVAGPGTAAYQPVQRGQVRRPGVQPQPQVSRAFCSEIAGVLSSTIGTFGLPWFGPPAAVRGVGTLPFPFRKGLNQEDRCKSNKQILWSHQRSCSRAAPRRRPQLLTSA